MCRHFMEKLEQTISQKPYRTKNRMTGKQTFNNSHRTKETLGLYTVYIYIYIYIYIQGLNWAGAVRG